VPDTVDHPPAPILPIGLYYPYVHMRNEEWVRLALLYWPRIARLVPQGYPVNDTRTVKTLIDELDWVSSYEGVKAKTALALGFDQLISALEELPTSQVLKARGDWIADYAVTSDLWSPPTWGAPRSLLRWRTKDEEDAVFGYMMADEFDPTLYRTMLELEYISPVSRSNLLALTGGVPRGDWVYIHRDLAWVYKCLLSEQMAHDNNMCTITDQPDAHAATSGIDPTELVVGGLNQDRMNIPASGAMLGVQFGLLALEAVTPANIAEVPLEKLIRLRKRHGEKFFAWRRDCEQKARAISVELAGITDQAVLDEYLKDCAHRYSKESLKGLDASLADVGLDAGRGAVSLKVQAPEVVTSVGGMLGGGAAGSSIAVAAGVAIGVASLYRTARASSRAKMQCPAGYLWYVRSELSEKTLVGHVQGLLLRLIGV
jgi:hypothetical protein